MDERPWSAQMIEAIPADLWIPFTEPFLRLVRGRLGDVAEIVLEVPFGARAHWETGLSEFEDIGE